MGTPTGKRSIRLLALGALLLCLAAGVGYWQAVGAGEENPRGNFWRVVRQGTPGFTTVTTQGHKILIQNGGENWREIRNGFLMKGSQWILAAALVGAAMFYLLVGSERLEKPRSGVKIERFTLGERILHWYTAVLFITMGITGLSLLLGRLFLIPVFGHPAVSGYLGAAKTLHNYCGPLLLAGIVLMFLTWVRYNIPEKMDLQWFKNMGGMIGRGPRPHAGRINGGQKGWFWLVVLFGIGVGITGVLLDFPIWGQSRSTMEVAHLIHVPLAVLFVTAFFGHIYMGTIGVEGAFEGMWTGSVDAVWAQQHADLWYQEKIGKREVGANPGTPLP